MKIGKECTYLEEYCLGFICGVWKLAMGWKCSVYKRNWIRCENFFFCCLFRAAPWHAEVPKVGVQSDLRLLAYTTAIATWDLSRVCDLHHSSRQRQILNPLSKARDQTRNLMVPSQIREPLPHDGTSHVMCFSSYSWLFRKTLFHIGSMIGISTWTEESFAKGSEFY